MYKKIGNTPILKINYKYKGKKDYIYSKLEFYNLTGSIKDRVAYYIIIEAYKKGLLKKNMPIIEATSGNTGISLSALGSYFGNPVRIYMPDWVSTERVKLMKMYNAEVVLVSKEEGGFKKAIHDAKEFAEKNNCFYCNQFENENNLLAHYETTGKEIINQLNEKIGGFVSGIGTGGTLMGTSKKLKETYNDLKVYALEPDKMPLLSKNKIITNHKEPSPFSLLKIYDIISKMQKNKNFIKWIEKRRKKMSNQNKKDLNKNLLSGQTNTNSPIFIEYPKCTTCQKAKKWLQSNNIEFLQRNIIEQTPTIEELTKWIKKSNQDIKKWFNTSGLKYRELNLKEKLADMTDKEKIDLLASDGMLIKRPLLISDKGIFTGFKEEIWKTLL